MLIRAALCLLLLLLLGPTALGKTKKKSKPKPKPVKVETVQKEASPQPSQWVQSIQVSPFVTGYSITAQDKLNGGEGRIYSKLSAGGEFRWQISGPVAPFASFQYTTLSLSPAVGQTLTASKSSMLGITAGVGIPLARKEPYWLSFFVRLKEELAVETQSDGSLIVRPFWATGLGAQLSFPLHYSKDFDLSARMGARYILPRTTAEVALSSSYEFTAGLGATQRFDVIRAGLYVNGVYQKLLTSTVDYSKIQIWVGASVGVSL